MSNQEVIIVRTGAANIASVTAALKRLSAKPRSSDDPREVEQAQYIVVPGVGSFAAAMMQLTASGLVEPLRKRVRAGKATLAICLGMQLLFEESEESPAHNGLSLLHGRAERFSEKVRVPQLGWNRVTADSDCRILDSGYVYFANSYRLTAMPKGWAAAKANYGGNFTAALERGNVVACQFHPELSGEFGLGIIDRWLNGRNGNGGSTC